MERRNLREKAAALPLCPGVYIMKDARETVLYVGKSKLLKNRVSQYFHPQAAHTPKTARMVSHVADFDVIVTGTEFEALVLENSLIKRHKPRYNILLKDDKGYPYIRFSLHEPYPSLSVVSRPMGDAARYFGPYVSRSSARNAIAALSDALKLPACDRKFPRDIGRERPCLNHHLGKCMAPCGGGVDPEAFREVCAQAVLLLEGKHEALAREIEAEMEQAAEALRFERAAQLRDRLSAVRRLGDRQSVASGGMADTDVVAFAAQGAKGCVAVLHYIGGTLLDKEAVLTDGFVEEDAAEVLSGFLTQYYGRRQTAPLEILLSAPVGDGEALETWLSGLRGRRVRLKAPQRGEKHRLVALALSNAGDEARRQQEAEKQDGKLLVLFGELLGLKAPPRRIEAFDISNTAGSAIVAGMVVFQDGKPRRSEYRRFKIKEFTDQNDVGAMAEAVSRRFAHLAEEDGKFAERPDLVLVDGGALQVSAAADAMDALDTRDIPVYGMVKDDKHRTRALVGRDGGELGLLATPAVFALVGRIQEETHRYAIQYHRLLRGKSGYGSALDNIEGVGERRKKALLKAFKTIGAIRNAEIEQLSKVVPRPVAMKIKEQLGAKASPEKEDV